MALDFGNRNFNNYIPVGTPGGGGFRGALRFYGNEMYGPDMTGAGDLAGSPVMDQAAAQYYGTGVAPVDTGGEGQASAQAKFANLLQGAASARGAANQGREQSRVAGAQGSEGVAEAVGSSLASNLSADMALQQAQDQSSLQNTGLISGLISSFLSPTGMGSNVVNAFTGQGGTPGTATTPGTAPQSGLAQLIAAIKAGFGGGGMSSFASLAGPETLAV